MCVSISPVMLRLCATQHGASFEDEGLLARATTGESSVVFSDGWGETETCHMCESHKKGSIMNTQERNKHQLQRLYDEVINTGDLERANLYITPDRPDNDPGLPPEMTRDREGFKLFFRMFRAAFPDQKFDSEFMVAEGEKVVAYGTVEGTHTGDFLGIEASGKPFKVRNIDICRFNAEGLIAEHWGLFDLAGMMRQLSEGGRR